jgi:hypothetical protein
MSLKATGRPMDLKVAQFPNSCSRADSTISPNVNNYNSPEDPTEATRGRAPIVDRGAQPSHGFGQERAQNPTALFIMKRCAVFIVAMCACIVVLDTSAVSTPIHPPELQKVGDCAITTITSITARLEGTSAHDTGSAIVYSDGVSGVSYEYVPALHASLIGDQVRLCLVSIIKNYPLVGDLGQEYQATNLRTGNHWASGYSSDYIREIAPYCGVDSNAAIAIFNKETGGGANLIGDMGSSFGPFQLHYGNMVPDVPRLNNPGLGDEFTAATGLDASDPSTWQSQVGFSLYMASTGGWTPWSIKQFINKSTFFLT